MSAASLEIPEMVMDDFLPDVQDVMGELRHEQQTLESFVLELIGQLDRIRQEMVERERQLEYEREQVAQHEAELQELLAANSVVAHDQEASAANQQLQEELAKSREKFASLELHCEELDRIRTDTSSALVLANEELDATRQELIQNRQYLEEQLDLVQQKLVSAQAELTELATGTDERATNLGQQLTAVQKQFAQAQQEREQAVEELRQCEQERARQQSLWDAAQEAATQQLNEARQELVTMQAELTLGREQLLSAQEPSQTRASARVSELEQEVQALEEELEITRRRGAELSDALAQQERDVNVERSGWTIELRELRRLFESRSVAVPIPDATVPPVAVVEVEPRRATAEPAADPVIGSVLQQFAQLQREASARRTKK